MAYGHACERVSEWCCCFAIASPQFHAKRKYFKLIVRIVFASRWKIARCGVRWCRAAWANVVDFLLSAFFPLLWMSAFFMENHVCIRASANWWFYNSSHARYTHTRSYVRRHSHMDLFPLISATPPCVTHWKFLSISVHNRSIYPFRLFKILTAGEMRERNTRVWICAMCITATLLRSSELFSIFCFCVCVSVCL